MKNLLFLKAAITLLSLTIGCWTLTTAKPVINPVEKSSSQVKQTKETRDLYVRNCARCHGADGRSETELGQKLFAADLTGRSVQKMSERKIIKVITNGSDEMPAFEKRLSEAEIKSIARYIRSF